LKQGQHNNNNELLTINGDIGDIGKQDPCPTHAAHCKAATSEINALPLAALSFVAALCLWRARAAVIALSVVIGVSDCPSACNKDRSIASAFSSAIPSATPIGGTPTYRDVAAVATEDPECELMSRATAAVSSFFNRRMSATRL
jgi:hypothetical protein